MPRRLQLAPRSHRLIAVAALCFFVISTHYAAAQKAATTPVPTPAAPTMPTDSGIELDRVVAIVNGDLILDSDVDEERRLTALQPYDDSREFSRDKAIERLINRTLILQQQKLQPEDPIPDDSVTKELDALRKTIPECKQYDCESDAGWQRFLAAHGFTPESLMKRWRSRMEVLRFIEERFRMGARIQPADIKTYYDQTLLPEYAKRHATAPPLASISDRIQEILLQRQVSNLLGEWLKSLRTQGSVVVLKQGEVAP